MPRFSERLQKYDVIFYNLFRASERSILDVVDDDIASIIDGNYSRFIRFKLDFQSETVHENRFNRERASRYFRADFPRYLSSIQKQILHYRYEQTPSLTLAAIGRTLGMTGEQVSYQLNKVFVLYKWVYEEGGSLDDSETVEEIWEKAFELKDEELINQLDSLSAKLFQDLKKKYTERLKMYKVFYRKFIKYAKPLIEERESRISGK